MEITESRGFAVELRHLLSGFLAAPGSDPGREHSLEVLFRLLGHLARVDGDGSAEERELAASMLQEQALPAPLRTRAMRAYDNADSLNLLSELERYFEVHPAGSPETIQLFDSLLRLALADGQVDAEERAFLEEVAKWLGINPAYIDWKLSAPHRVS